MVFVVGQAWRWHNVLAVDPREDGRVPRAGCAIRCGPHHGEAYTVNPGKAERERDGLTDSFGRRFRYLRLSITEVCNFRCIYCLPNGYGRDPQAQFLSLEEVRRLVAGFAGLGVTKVRLTGGEPSVRPDLPAILAATAEAPGITRVAMTTNGWRLGDRIDQWREAGLTHLNVSVDSLDRETFTWLTGHDRLPDILDGIDRAIDL